MFAFEFLLGTLNDIRTAIGHVLGIPNVAAVLPLNSSTRERALSANVVALVARAVRQAGGTVEFQVVGATALGGAGIDAIHGMTADVTNVYVVGDYEKTMTLGEPVTSAGSFDAFAAAIDVKGNIVFGVRLRWADPRDRDRRRARPAVVGTYSEKAQFGLGESRSALGPTDAFVATLSLLSP